MITYHGILDVPDHLCHTVAVWLCTHRRIHDIRPWQRAATPRSQAIMFLRWARDASRIHVIARDAQVSLATAYRYIQEAITVVASHQMSLQQVIDQIKNHSSLWVMVDGTLIESDRVHRINPATGHDLWYSGKHKCFGGNIQVLMDATGYPLWSSPVEPGSTHDITAARQHVLGSLYALAGDGVVTLADKGYIGAGIGVHTPVRGHRDQLDVNTRTRNRLIADLRAPCERANAMLKTWKCLQHVSLDPNRIGDITAAMLVLTHLKYPSPYSW